MEKDIVSQYEQAEDALLSLLAARCTDESAYQRLIERYPSLLGGQYVGVVRHRGLAGPHIPDFLAIRATDSCLDVVEIKQPFAAVTNKSGGFRSEFLQAIDQAERYLDHVTRAADLLLSDHRLRFHSPRCLLIVGCQLSDSDTRAVRRKQRTMTTRVDLLTYDMLIAQAAHTIGLVGRANTGLRAGDAGAIREFDGVQAENWWLVADTPHIPLRVNQAYHHLNRLLTNVAMFHGIASAPGLLDRRRTWARLARFGIVPERCLEHQDELWQIFEAIMDGYTVSEAKAKWYTDTVYDLASALRSALPAQTTLSRDILPGCWGPVVP